MSEWLDWLREGVGRASGGAPLAMVSVLACEGSAPRGPGTRMLANAARQWGTIGGGALEFRALEQARAILNHPPGSWRVQDYPLGPLLGQCCGGRVRILVEHVDRERLEWLQLVSPQSVLVTHFEADGIARHTAAEADLAPLGARGERPGAGTSFAEVVGQSRRPLYLFGAGHVGQAIARHAHGLPLRLAWFDTRPLFETIAGVAIVPDSQIAQCVAEAPPEAAIVILTHDHGLDYRLALAALSRAPVHFVGLIGSVTKRARFLARLERDGMDESARARLTCPIGLAGIAGKEPDVIAIAVLAQLLQLGAA
ncbi:MAG TPA: xanthine dehydrogenase accessory protein XdhC [Novosphingobium sp.]|nr:xanthine dehydrogenase accessory protein XdhC [Novosphingobium sp.]